MQITFWLDIMQCNFLNLENEFSPSASCNNFSTACRDRQRLRVGFDCLDLDSYGLDPRGYCCFDYFELK